MCDAPPKKKQKTMDENYSERLETTFEAYNRLLQEHINNPEKNPPPTALISAERKQLPNIKKI